MDLVHTWWSRWWGRVAREDLVQLLNDWTKKSWKKKEKGGKKRAQVVFVEDEDGGIWERFLLAVSCRCNVGTISTGNLEALQWSWLLVHCFWFRSAWFLVGPCTLLSRGAKQSKKGWGKEAANQHWTICLKHLLIEVGSASHEMSLCTACLCLLVRVRKTGFFPMHVTLSCVSSAFDNC